MKLRDYQIEAKQAVKAEFLKGNKKVVLCSPTGSGKTVTFASICIDVIRKGKSVMIVCDRKELISQAKAKLFDYGLIPTIIAPGHKFITKSCYIASIDTLVRRHYPEVDLIVIDEAHKQTFDKIIDAYAEFPNTFIIGATATPFRKGKQRQLYSLYDSIVEPTNISELIELGFLMPTRTYGAKMDLSDIKTKGQDYDENSMFSKFNHSKLYDGVVSNYQKFAPGTKALCFNINVEHSKKMNQAFLDAGIASEHVDGNTPDAIRKAALSAFKMGHIKVLNNCSLFTTGYDEPSIETVIINRATKSMPLWLQMAGRGSRPFVNKKHFNLIDMGSNTYEHGFWEQERPWSLTHKTVKKESVAPVKECPQCKALMHTTIKICTYCGHIFAIEEKKLLQGDFDLLLPNLAVPDHLNKKWRDMNIVELEELRVFKKYKMGWIIRQLKERGRQALEVYAQMKDYSDGWIKYQMEN